MEDVIGIEIEAVALDSGYDTGLIHQTMEEKCIKIFTPKSKAQDKTKVAFKRDAFKYNESDDTFTCPNGKVLTLRQLERSTSTISREYATSVKDCRDCPLRSKCLAPSQNARRLGVNIFEEAVRKHHERDGTPEHRKALMQRQIMCEGTFGNQKQQHNLNNFNRRGIKAAREHALLSATAVNIKKLIKMAG
jgi:uncharacterized protein (UPF0179 family)